VSPSIDAMAGSRRLRRGSSEIARSRSARPKLSRAGDAAGADGERGRGARAKPRSARSGWSACGIVTLTTDFGLHDPYVAAMKGVILSAARDATIVDVTHDIPPQDVRTAAWILKHTRDSFPRGTVHVAVVDPGVGSERKLIVAEDRGQVFLAPDNGLLAPLLSSAAHVFELDARRFARPGASRTFHGRDILAPAAARLARDLEPEDCARQRMRRWVELDFPRPRNRKRGDVAGEILIRDRYGNLVTNLFPADLAAAGAADLGRWCIVVGARRIPIRGTYAEAASGELLALVDSYGALEIAVRDGSAADRLRLRPGAAITARRIS
jgi:S-adenosylmethionine hydrolase